MSNKQLKGFYFCVILFFIGNVIIWAIVGFVYNTSYFELSKAFKIDAGLYAVLQILDLILSVILIHLFLGKLLSFMQQFNDRDSFRIDDNSSSYQYTLTSEQRSIVDIMTKTFILSLFVIISTQISLISNTFLYLMVGYRDYKIYMIFYIIQTMISSVNCIMSSICIFLNFDFGGYIYHKLLCHKIHIYFSILFKNYSKQKIIDQMRNEHYQQLDEDAIYNDPNHDKDDNDNETI